MKSAKLWPLSLFVVKDDQKESGSESESSESEEENGEEEDGEEENGEEEDGEEEKNGEEEDGEEEENGESGEGAASDTEPLSYRSYLKTSMYFMAEYMSIGNFDSEFKHLTPSQ
jgi:hypothetical protein